ncbi:MAG: GntR family transcriptional regulator [Algoriphagus sp.]|jgi:GntR family transcriptional regulator|uniref:GntR family transcriptional regulator n=1 Tax=Algoriphagus sp. TaxID=1872435 RepID=UPI0026153E7C|nr:GntR family transcriptional regulator [Algoriphagus sp.]MDG1277738.1 GntR family transcriptional regulator [Algoriphagus sp.]
MDFNESKNIFLQIRDWLADQIMQDKILPGDKVPSVRELAVDLEVNRNTVMRSYGLMEEEGILENKRGIGFFVATDAKRNLLKIQKESFFEQDLPGLLHKVKVLKLNSTDLQSLIQSIQSNDHEN